LVFDENKEQRIIEKDIEDTFMEEKIQMQVLKSLKFILIYQ
jgi:hypothetical protein